MQYEQRTVSTGEQRGRSCPAGDIEGAIHLDLGRIDACKLLETYRLREMEPYRRRIPCISHDTGIVTLQRLVEPAVPVAGKPDAILDVSERCLVTAGNRWLAASNLSATRMGRTSSAL
jgi:hypothetical protein